MADTPPKRRAVNPIAVAEEIARGLIPGECLDDLLRGPRRGGMPGDVDMHHASALRVQDGRRNGRFPR
jgi:hypothetical protein